MGCGCGGSSGILLRGGRQTGGGCPCALGTMNGGYRATKRNLRYLRKWRRGESIGFTMRSSLKAKGLIPRANGTRRVSAKWSAKSFHQPSAKYQKRRLTRRRRLVEAFSRSLRRR